MSRLSKTFEIDGVKTDMTSVVLSDPTGAYGVKRNDTDAVVVADGAAMTHDATGVYSYTFTDPADDLTYTYWVELTYGGETYYVEGTLSGPEAEAESSGTGIAEAIRNFLLTQDAITADLATYDFGPEGPAIFTIDPIPEDAALPAVVIAEISGDRWGTRERKGAIYSADVTLWGDKETSKTDLRDLAWKLFFALERATLNPAGAYAIMTTAKPPGALKDPEGFPGFNVSVTVHLLAK